MYSRPLLCQSGCLLQGSSDSSFNRISAIFSHSMCVRSATSSAVAYRAAVSWRIRLARSWIVRLLGELMSVLDDIFAALAKVMLSAEKRLWRQIRSACPDLNRKNIIRVDGLH